MGSSPYEKHYDEWEELYEEQHLSASEIADKFNCSESAVYNGLDARGVDRTYKGKYRQHYSDWEQLYVEGKMSSEEIAEEYGCDSSTVRTALDNIGIDRRSLSESLRNRDYSGDFRDRSSHLEGHRGEIKEMYLSQRMTLEEIASYLDCSAWSVRRLLVKDGIEIRDVGDYDQTQYGPSCKRQWAEAYRGGSNVREIAERWGCDPHTVGRGLSELGVDVSTGISPTPPKDQFWENVDKGSSGECWKWDGPKSTYGRIYFPDEGCEMTANRFSFVLHHRELDDDEVVKRSCGSKSCVNPAHLFAVRWGTDPESRYSIISSGDDIDRSELLRRQGGNCAYCGEDITDESHLDHKTPLSRGGEHIWENVQLTCPTCNCRKSDSTHEEFLSE